MLVPAVTLFQAILALHIIAVVVGFGVAFAWPLIYAGIARADPRSLPAIYRVERLVEQRLMSPALLVILAAGIYLASKSHAWHAFYVQWGVAAVIVIGALTGAVMAPTERRLAEVTEQDLLAAGDGPMTASAEQQGLTRRLQLVGTAASLIVILTIIFMVFQTGS